MILVDSSVWISYFHERDSRTADHLDRCLDQGKNIATLPLIITEVLSGFREDKDFKIAHGILTKVPIIPIGFETYIRSAQLYRKLRKKGITIQSPIDCLIAQVSIEMNAFVFTLDKDFQKIKSETALQLMEWK